jgi:TRAP-type mannitol/chloroaromatic compound transport system permease small subunit
MNKWLWRIDATSTFVGKAFAWLIVALTLHVSWEVFARYLFNRPSAWAFDMQLMYYGIMFMMAGA